MRKIMTEEEKYVWMTETPISKLISTLAIPTIISMLVTSVYNMADTFFLGQMKGDRPTIDAATGAAAVVFSLMAIIQACGFFFGQGSGTYISRALGKQDREDASRMAVFGFVTSMLFGLCITVLGFIFLEPLAIGLGADKNILPYAKEYMFYILLAAPFMCGSFVLNNQMRFQGNAVYSMVGIVSGAVINVGLDALFILVFNMGASGAGLATAIGQTSGFIVLFIGMKLGNNIHLELRKYRFSFTLLKHVFIGGTPSLARQGLASVSSIMMSHIAGIYGSTSAIADMGKISRIMNFCFSAALGFGQGFQPVCGFNYGAKKYDRVKQGYFFCIKISAVAILVVTAAIFALSPQIADIFKGTKLTSDGLRLQCISFQFIGMITFTNMMLQTIGKVVPATVLSMARNGIFFIPSVLLLPFLFGETGLILVQPAADVLAFALSVWLGVKEVKELNRLIKENSVPSAALASAASAAPSSTEISANPSPAEEGVAPSSEPSPASLPIEPLVNPSPAEEAQSNSESVDSSSADLGDFAEKSPESHKNDDTDNP